MANQKQLVAAFVVVTIPILVLAGCSENIQPPVQRVDGDVEAPPIVRLLNSTEDILREAESYRPKTIGRIDDLSVDAVELLSQIPGVVRVSYSGSQAVPSHRIVHVLDWHFVSRDDYLADLRSVRGEPIADEEFAERYAELIQEVDEIQQQQMAVMRCLIRHHGLERVHAEGLAEEDRSVLAAKVQVVRNAERELNLFKAEFADVLSDADDSSRNVTDGLRDLEQGHHESLLQLSAAGRLLLHGEIDELLPLEDEAAYQAANPIGEDGTVRIDEEAMEARCAAQVRLLLRTGPFAMIVLGGANDLSSHVDRLSGGTAEYIRVEVQAWSEHAADLVPNHTDAADEGSTQ